MPSAENDVWQLIQNLRSLKLGGFDNFSRLDAAGASFDSAVSSSRELNPDGLQIRIEPASSLVVSV